MSKEPYFASNGKHRDRRSFSSIYRPPCPKAYFYTLNWPRFRVGDYYWWRNHCRRRRWVSRICRWIKLDAGRVALLTVKFKGYVSVVRAKELGRKIIRRLVGRFIGPGWVQVVERNEQGRAHIHFLLRVLPWWAVREGIHEIRVEVLSRWDAARTTEIRTIDQQHARLAWYLTKGQARRNWKVKVLRGVTCSQEVRSA